MSKRLFVVVAMLVGGLCGRARAETDTERLDRVLERANAQKKAVLIEFQTSWCEACKVFDSEVFLKPEVARALRNVVFVRFDAEQGMAGPEAAQRYGVKEYPTFIAVDGKGVERFRRTFAQFQDAAGFVAMIKQVRERVEDEGDLKRRLEKRGDDPTANLDAAKWYGARNEVAKALAQAKLAMRSGAPPTVKREATRFAEHLKRVDTWKRELVKGRETLLGEDYSAAEADDLVIATVGSVLEAKARTALVAKVLRANENRDSVVPLLYVALAADLPAEALAAAEKLTTQHDVERLRVVAECYHAAGKRSAAVTAIEEALALASGDAEVRADRDRIVNEGGESPRVTTIRMLATDVWRRLEAVDGLTKHMAAAVPSPFVTLFRATQLLGPQVGTACSRYATDDKAYVNVEVDAPAGRITSHTLFTETNPSDALRTCIDKELSAATLPSVAGTIPTQLIPVVFRRTKKP